MAGSFDDELISALQKMDARAIAILLSSFKYHGLSFRPAFAVC